MLGQDESPLLENRLYNFFLAFKINTYGLEEGYLQKIDLCWLHIGGELF